MKDLMRKVNRVYKTDKKKWFIDHEPHIVHWAYVMLGNSPVALHYTMFLSTC